MSRYKVCTRCGSAELLVARLKAEVARQRQVLEAAIEGMIAGLDGLDGDADYEPCNDDEDGADLEPSLGWSDVGGWQGPTATAFAVDAED